jgi:cell wall-associated NlpC family hydrolase
MTRLRRLVGTKRRAAVAVLLVAGAAVLLASRGGDDNNPAKRSRTVASTEPGAGVVRDPEEAQSFPEPASAVSHPVAEDPAAVAETAETGVSPGAPSDEEVRRDLRQLERYYNGRGGGGKGITLVDGEAQAAPDVPDVIAQVVAGGNAIARFPYRWGGGHGSFLDDAYDCSGSVSYALATAGLLDVPLASGEFADWGRAGPGRWITVYANAGHVYMEVGGIRFDTSGRAGRRGSRWQLAGRSGRGFEVRHPPGL